MLGPSLKEISATTEGKKQIILSFIFSMVLLCFFWIFNEFSRRKPTFSALFAPLEWEYKTNEMSLHDRLQPVAQAHVRIYYAHVACSVWSRAPGWGEPWFPHSAVLLFLISSVWRSTWCSLFFCFFLAIPFLRMMQSHYPNCADGPFSPCCCFWFCFGCVFFCFWLFCFLYLIWFAVVSFCWFGLRCLYSAWWWLRGLCTGPPSARPLSHLLTKMDEF